MSAQTNGTETPTTQANGESSAQNGESSSLENIDAGRLGNLENNWQNLAAAAAAVSNPYGVPVCKIFSLLEKTASPNLTHLEKWQIALILFLYHNDFLQDHLESFEEIGSSLILLQEFPYLRF